MMLPVFLLYQKGGIMRRLLSNQLTPGMVVAQDVLSFDNQMILAKDTVLTDNIILKLNMYDVVFVNVHDKIVPVPIMDPHVSSYSERVRKSEDFQKFKEKYEDEVSSFKDMLNNVVERNITLDVNALLQESLAIIKSTDGKTGVLDMLQNMREYDDSTFAHSLNVGLICNIFAGWLKLGEEETNMVTACGLLHDIGKLMIPHHIIAKPGKLTDTEYESIKKHPQLGYHLLASQNTDTAICNAALMHHERCDGTGYPLKLHREQLSGYSKIVSIADVYDAMTAARVYRGPLCPFHVIQVFEDEGIQKYDVGYILTFLENVANTYIGNRCKLSDGREGTIIFINKNNYSRPMVQCEDEYVNLAERKGMSVMYLL